KLAPKSQCLQHLATAVGWGIGFYLPTRADCRMILLVSGVVMRPMMKRALALAIAVTASTSAFAHRASLTDQQIAEIMVHGSRQAYYSTGRPCACPDDLARNGSRCGLRSTYSRPGGASPKCFPSDVAATDIAAFRTHRSSP